MIHKKNNKILKLKTFFFLLFSLFFILFAWYKINVLKAVDSHDNSEINFIIKNYDSVRTIASNLKEKNLINSDLAFYIYIRLNNLDRKLKSGIFKLNKSQNIKEIAYTFTDIKNGQFILTIPEGYTIKQTDDLLTNEGFINSGDYISCAETCDFDKFNFLNGSKSLEGFLFPDTYFINPGNFVVKDLIDLQLKTFEKKALPLYKESNSDKGLNEIIIMSSIIEKEIRTEKDLPIVSGILWKRLDNNWLLGADATLLYGEDDLQISAEELQEKSPYNTRRVHGLPPTAICNPGIKSINAALYPKNSEYWFYLTVPESGEVVYARTNEEQNVNREEYL